MFCFQHVQTDSSHQFKKIQAQQVHGHPDRHIASLLQQYHQERRRRRKLREICFRDSFYGRLYTRRKAMETGHNPEVNQYNYMEKE